MSAVGVRARSSRKRPTLTRAIPVLANGAPKAKRSASFRCGSRMKMPRMTPNTIPAAPSRRNGYCHPNFWASQPASAPPPIVPA